MARWLDIPGYEGIYSVSDAGDVMSLARDINHIIMKRRKAALLKPETTRFGYQRVVLRKDGKVKHYMVHVLVLLAFVGPPPEGHQVRHLDGKRSNNSLSNLCYGTALENAEDTIRHGTRRMGETHHCAKLTDKDIEDIRRLHMEGLRYSDISKRYPVTARYVREICLGVYRSTPKALNATRA